MSATSIVTYTPQFLTTVSYSARKPRSMLASEMRSSWGVGEVGGAAPGS